MMTPEQQAELIADYKAQLPHILDHDPAPITCERVLWYVGAEFGVSVGKLRGANRQAHVAQARFAAMKIMHEDLGKTLAEIGRLVGNRDYTTIINALRRCDEIAEHNAKYRGAIGRARAALGLMGHG